MAATRALSRSLALTLTLPLLLFAALARAQENGVDVDTRVSAYADDDATTVVTSVVAVGGRVLDVLGLRAYGLVDIVSTASVDVVSAATAHFDETRRELGVAPSYDDGTRSLSAAYRYSVEEDWSSHTVSASGSHDFFRHDLELSLGLSVTHNDIGRAEDASFARELRQYGATLAAVVTASPSDIWAVTYAPSFLDGYQASPYRFVYYLAPGVTGRVSAPELVPERRLRHPVTLMWNHHLLRDSALRSHARAYIDDWGVVSGTVGTEYVHGLGHFDPAVFVRGYTQSGAEFWQDGYASRRRYLTADRELSPFWDVFAGFKLPYRSSRLGFFEQVRAELKIAAFWFSFSDFERLPTRRGLLGDVAIGGSF